MMRGWMRLLLLAALACAAAGACARGGEIAAPDGTDARMDGSAPPAQDPGDATTPTDSSGRWGGYIGGGG